MERFEDAHIFIFLYIHIYKHTHTYVNMCNELGFCTQTFLIFFHTHIICYMGFFQFCGFKSLAIFFELIEKMIISLKHLFSH
jgi:hypothetical protein